jgi:hypothetical protein
MNFSKSIAVTFSILCLTFAGNASATLIEVDYSVFSASGWDINVTVGADTINVQGWVWDPTANSNTGGFVRAAVISNKNGLGIKGGDDKNRIGNDDNISLGHGDYLVFTTNFAFNALDLVFADSNKKVALSANETAGVDIGFLGSFIADASVTGGVLDFALTDIYGSTFAIKATGGGNGFKLDSVVFSVPEPTTLSIFAFMLIGLITRRT